LPLLFNLISVYTIRRVQESQVGLKFNGTHQLLIYADDINLLRDNVNIINKNKENLMHERKEVGLEVTQRKLSTCRCVVTRMWHKIIIEYVAKIKYLETTLTN
jgi:hypothetical protein